ncbi:MAG TPA: FecR family protein [Reyranella sp.]|nr:FecR family protein [Reyranella sp.]
MTVQTGAFAQAPVGVTSATSGGPLGKPPAEAERVLHVGVDVKANEVITTGASDRAHLVFLDGSSLTVGPQARLTIDSFVYDAGAKRGTIALNASQGVLRFVGGKISKTAPVTVTTPSATLTIRGGIMLIEIDGAHTVATFIFGKDMTVTAKGKTQVVTRPGWQVVAYAGAAPGTPQQAPPELLKTELGQLEGTPGGSNAADEKVKVLGQGGPGTGTPLNPAAIDAAAGALSDSNVQLQKPTLPPPTPPSPGPRTNR